MKKSQVPEWRRGVWRAARHRWREALEPFSSRLWVVVYPAGLGRAREFRGIPTTYSRAAQGADRLGALRVEPFRKRPRR